MRSLEIFGRQRKRESGRVLFGVWGEAEEDADAEWPRVLGEVPASEPLGAAMHEMSRPKPPDEEPGPEANPPAAERVARRALALVAVTARAILEQDDASAEHVRNTYADLLAWVTEIGLEVLPHGFEDQAAIGIA